MNKSNFAKFKLLAVTALIASIGLANNVYSMNKNDTTARRHKIIAPDLEMSFNNTTTQVDHLFKLNIDQHFSSDETFFVCLLQAKGQKLPDWLTYDETSGLLFGVPSATEIGEIVIKVAAFNESAKEVLPRISKRIRPQPFDNCKNRPGRGYSTRNALTLTSFNITINNQSSNLTDAEIFQDNDYIKDLLTKESNFLTAGIAFDDVTGLTYDGIKIDRDSLLIDGLPREHSASSKESLHINVLTKALLGDERAQLLIAGNTDNANEIALSVLEKKIASYHEFNENYPGFGGYLPWFVSRNGYLEPISGWSNQTPSLDNGQLAWSLYFAYNALTDLGYNELAEQYKAYFDLMALNAKHMFFDSENNTIVGISQFDHPESSPSEQTYAKKGYALIDPFEGELMVYFMTLFSPDITQQEIDNVWQKKFLNTSEYTDSEGNNITVVQGWAFSSHEQWKYLVLPYFDNDKARALFINGEKVRADYSNRRGFDGFFASIHNSKLQYVNKQGVQTVATENVTTSVVAPYAAFTTILADKLTNSNSGLAWLQHTLSQDGMLGTYGMTEGIETTTGDISPLLTWDGKVLTDLALLNGVYNETRQFLIRDGLYLEFLAHLDSEFNKITTPIYGTELQVAQPAPIPVQAPVNDEIFTDEIGADWSDIGYQEPLNTHVEMNEIMLSDDDVVMDFTHHADGNNAVSWIETAQPKDISEYLTLTFDIRVLNKSEASGNFMVKVEDALGHSTGDMSIGAPILNQWHTISISLAEVAQRGVDLTYINKPLVIFPQWGDQQGINFQLNNIKLSKELPPAQALYVFDEIVDTSIWNEGLQPNTTHIIHSVQNLENGDAVLQLDHQADGANSVSWIGSSTAKDLSNYESLTFELKVLDYGNNQDGFKVKLEGSGASREVNAGKPALEQWTSINLTLSELAASGLDLNQVKRVVFFPAWGQQQGVKFQINNMRFIPQASELNVYSDNLDTATWDEGIMPVTDHVVHTEVALADGNKVLQFEHLADGGNSVSWIGAHNTLDVSSFSTVSFDLNVLDYGNNTEGFKFKLEGVGSANEIFSAKPELNKWTKVTLSLEVLALNGLDLSQVNKLVFFPSWGQQQGVSFQIDNIRFNK